VKKGQVLFRLDSTVQELDVQRAEIRLKLAKAKLDQLQGGAREEQRKMAQAEVAIAEAGLKNAEAQFERLKRLLASAAVSKEELLRGESEVRSAMAQLEKQRAALKAVEKGAPEEEVTAARLAVDAAQVEVKRARAALDATLILAPFEGMVLRVGVEAGSFTNPAAVGLASASSLCELVDVSALLVEVTLPQEAFGMVKAGAPCEVIVPSRQQKALEGKVDRIIPVIDPVRSSFTVRVKLAGKEELPIGATVGVRFAPQK
jgi:HlyD family secretion protein